LLDLASEDHFFRWEVFLNYSRIFESGLAGDNLLGLSPLTWSLEMDWVSDYNG
jgi:hypothetical protein